MQWNGHEVSRPPYREMYWSPAQMLAHLTVNGAPTRTGDLFASGTISGPGKETRGAFIELTWGGAEPVAVSGEQRTFLEDGDEVVITASAPGPNGPGSASARQEAGYSQPEDSPDPGRLVPMQGQFDGSCGSHRRQMPSFQPRHRAP